MSGWTSSYFAALNPAVVCAVAPWRTKVGFVDSHGAASLPPNAGEEATFGWSAIFRKSRGIVGSACKCDFIISLFSFLMRELFTTSNSHSACRLLLQESVAFLVSITLTKKAFQTSHGLPGRIILHVYRFHALTCTPSRIGIGGLCQGGRCRGFFFFFFFSSSSIQHRGWRCDCYSRSSARKKRLGDRQDVTK